MDKMERFLLKGPGKLDMVVGAIVCLALFFAYRIGLGIDAGWTYILLLFLAVLILIVFAKDREVFIKVCAIITIFYSVVRLIKPDLIEKWFAFNFVGKLLAVAFSIFIAFFGFLIGSFWRWIIWVVIYGGYYSITAPIRRKLPQTKSIVRKDKCIYLHEDYRDKQTQLIYRKGKRKLMKLSKKESCIMSKYNIKKVYPYGKTKSFNVTYDDGVLQDVRFVEMLNKYKLKGTFNLNSGLMENEFEWTHEKGCIVKRLSKEKVLSLYNGHEIASHTLTHPFLDGKTEEDIMYELKEDKKNLEKLFGIEIKGFAAPFDYYSDLIETCVKKSGFEYARISEESLSFKPQTDYYRWRATVFHLDDSLEKLVREFLSTDEELAMFQIVGHSYDLDTENMWDEIETVFRQISLQEDICAMTTIEIINYLKAMNEAEIADGYIVNNSEESLWFSVNGNVCEVEPKNKIAISIDIFYNESDN